MIQIVIVSNDWIKKLNNQFLKLENTKNVTERHHLSRLWDFLWGREPHVDVIYDNFHLTAFNNLNACSNSDQVVIT